MKNSSGNFKDLFTVKTSESPIFDELKERLKVKIDCRKGLFEDLNQSRDAKVKRTLRVHGDLIEAFKDDFAESQGAQSDDLLQQLDTIETSYNQEAPLTFGRGALLAVENGGNLSKNIREKIQPQLENFPRPLLPPPQIVGYTMKPENGKYNIAVHTKTGKERNEIEIRDAQTNLANESFSFHEIYDYLTDLQELHRDVAALADDQSTETDPAIVFDRLLSFVQKPMNQKTIEKLEHAYPRDGSEKAKKWFETLQYVKEAAFPESSSTWKPPKDRVPFEIEHAGAPQRASQGRS